MLGGGVRKISSPYGVGGETGYTAQENQKSINSYNMGGGAAGRTIRVWFSILAFQDLLGFICSFVHGSPQRCNVKHGNFS